MKKRANWQEPGGAEAEKGCYVASFEGGERGHKVRDTGGH